MHPYVSGANSLCVCLTTPTPRIFGARPYIWRSRVKNERHVNKTSLTHVILLFNPFTPKISLVILLTVCYTIHMSLV